MPEYSTYLAQRREEGVNLYHCVGDGRGFFVEMGVDDGRWWAMMFKSFSETGPLADCASYLQLPG